MKPSSVYAQTAAASNLPSLPEITEALQSRHASKGILRLEKIGGQKIEKQLYLAISALSSAFQSSSSSTASDSSLGHGRSEGKEFQSVSVINSTLNFPPPFTGEADMLLTSIFTKTIRSINLRGSVATAAQAGLILASVAECDNLAYLDISGFAPPTNPDESDALREGIQSAFGVPRLMRLGIESSYENQITSVIFSMLPASSLRVLSIGDIFDGDERKNDIDLAFEVAEALRLSTSIRGLSFSFNRRACVSDDVIEVLREAVKTTVSLVSLVIGNNADEGLKIEIEGQMDINMFIATGRSVTDKVEQRARTKVLTAIHQLADGMDFICAGAAVHIDKALKERQMSELRGIFKRLQLATLLEQESGGDVKTLKLLVEDKVKPVRVHSNTLKILNDVLKESVLKNAEKSCVVFSHAIPERQVATKVDDGGKDISLKDLVPEPVAVEPKGKEKEKNKGKDSKSSKDKGGKKADKKKGKSSDCSDTSASLDVEKGRNKNKADAQQRKDVPVVMSCDCSARLAKLEELVNAQATQIQTLQRQNVELRSQLNDVAFNVTQVSQAPALRQMVERLARGIVDETVGGLLADDSSKVTKEELETKCTTLESSIAAVRKTSENTTRKLRMLDTKFGVAENDIRDLNDKVEKPGVSRGEIDSLRDNIQTQIDTLQRNINAAITQVTSTQGDSKNVEELQENINIMLAELDEKLQLNTSRIEEVGKKAELTATREGDGKDMVDKKRIETIENTMSGITVRIQSSVESLVSLIAASQGELESKFDSQMKVIEDRIGSLESATILEAGLLRSHAASYE